MKKDASLYILIFLLISLFALLVLLFSAGSSTGFQAYGSLIGMNELNQTVQQVKDYVFKRVVSQEKVRRYDIIEQIRLKRNASE